MPQGPASARSRSLGTLLPWQEPGEGQGEKATKAEAEEGPRTGPGLLHPSQPQPPLFPVEPTGMLPAQPCPRAPLQRSQPTLPTARQPTSSTGRGTPFAHPPPGTNPLELAPHRFPCPAVFCDAVPFPLVTAEGEPHVAQPAPAPSRPRATPQHHASKVLSPKCLSQPTIRAGDPGREGLAGCVSALVAGTAGTHPAQGAQVPQHRGVCKPSRSPRCPDKGWLGAAFSPGSPVQER